MNDEEAYKPYRRQPGIFRKYGGRFVVRGGKYEPEGKRTRNVVVEFPDYARGRVLRSPEYQQNENPAGHALADLIIVEGYDGPQP